MESSLRDLANNRAEQLNLGLFLKNNQNTHYTVKTNACLRYEGETGEVRNVVIC